MSNIEIAQTIYTAIGVFFLLYLIGYSAFLFVSVLVGAASMYKTKRERIMKNIDDKKYYIPVSIVIPAYNEDVTIVDSIKSMLTLEYTLYEIIIVDDGSTDNTAKKIIENFGLRKTNRPICKKLKTKNILDIYESNEYKVPITLLKKENGGKADSLNAGICASRYPYFICVDADSMLQKDSLQEIVRPILEYPDIIAVGGVVRPANGVEIRNGEIKKYRLPKSIIASMQVLEYDRSFLAARILFDKFNGGLIISGAFGLFKKDVVIACNGYNPNTVGEDMELVMRIHEFCVINDIPYRIKYATSAICWSQVPNTLHDLRKQRKRWHKGLRDSMHFHKKMLGDMRFGLIGLISYVYFMLYELYSPFIELFGIASIIFALITDLLNPMFMVAFFLLYALFGSIMSLTAFFSRVHTMDLKLRFRDVLKVILLCFIEIVFLRFIMAITRMFAFSQFNKKKYEWGKITRSALQENTNVM